MVSDAGRPVAGPVLSVRTVGGYVLVTVAGVVGPGDIKQLRADLAVQAGGGARLVVDLSGVEFGDLTLGVGMLAGVRNRVIEAGGSLLLVVDETLSLALRRIGVYEAIGAHASLAEIDDVLA
ncbi:hypothetical protein KZZ52_28750 [Dactylosporangium sp. AC04546]|uniref:hypothetical protein n=1 Tax=Dactylosporangium sp. AC04546 TaxID=2862460 RepID=UPI001EDCF5C1|nr:hypothetical protein [Dactylosporangium sp. AC04546]WVK89260.1 hypothetical protein KZZ52_28750 [Dactylosporangium sp. AC04546]